MAKGDRFRPVGQLHPVERPHIAFHVGGKVDVQRSGRRARVAVWLQRFQIGIGEDAVIDILQARGAVGGPVSRHGRQGSHARSHRNLGRNRWIEHLHRMARHAVIGGLAEVDHAIVPHIHAAHVHAHVLHGQQRPLAQGRDRRDHPDLRCQRRAHQPGPVDRLGDQAIGLRFGWLDDHVICLGDRDLELVGLDRLDMLAVALDHCHGEAGQPQVEIGHGRCVDDAQPHPLARSEQAGPVFRCAMAVHQIAVGRSGDVRNVGGVHPHPAPVHPVLNAPVPAL